MGYTGTHGKSRRLKEKEDDIKSLKVTINTRRDEFVWSDPPTAESWRGRSLALVLQQASVLLRWLASMCQD